MFKIIAVDLDETLLNDQKHVSKADIETISQLQDCKLVIATGRGFMGVQDILKEIGQYNQPNTYLMSFNGGYITENLNNKPLYSSSLSYEETKKIFEIGKKYDIAVQIFKPDMFYIYNMNDDERDWLNKVNLDYREFNSFEQAFKEDETFTKVLFNKPDMDYLRKIKQEINLDDKYSISFSSNRYLEINPIGINKGNGLKKLCEILNVDIKDTIGVGDNINDIDLIKTAGLGIGVANTVQEVRKYCDVILESTNNENPITEIVNRFIKKRN